MTEKQPTSVEWLVNQMKQRENQGLTLSMYELEMFGEQADKMHKEQIMKAYKQGFVRELGNRDEDIEQYYNETYKSE